MLNVKCTEKCDANLIWFCINNESRIYAKSETIIVKYLYRFILRTVETRRSATVLLRLLYYCWSSNLYELGSIWKNAWQQCESEINLGDRDTYPLYFQLNEPNCIYLRLGNR